MHTYHFIPWTQHIALPALRLCTTVAAAAAAAAAATGCVPMPLVSPLPVLRDHVFGRPRPTSCSNWPLQVRGSRAYRGRGCASVWCLWLTAPRTTAAASKKKSGKKKKTAKPRPVDTDRDGPPADELSDEPETPAMVQVRCSSATGVFFFLLHPHAALD